MSLNIIAITSHARATSSASRLLTIRKRCVESPLLGGPYRAWLMMVGRLKSIGAARMASRMPAQCSTLPRGEPHERWATENSSPTRCPRKAAHRYALPGGNSSGKLAVVNGRAGHGLALIRTRRRASCNGKPCNDLHELPPPCGSECTQDAHGG